MERNLAFEKDPEKFRKEWLDKEKELSHQIELARGFVDRVTYTSRDLLSIAGLTASLNVEGHRADLVILKTARAQAAFEGRKSITERDIALAAELALPHRIRQGPFQQSVISEDELQERIEQLQGSTVSAGEPEPMAEDEDHTPHFDKKKRPKPHIAGRPTESEPE
jgi:Mg-chelatase subunit ChlI